VGQIVVVFAWPQKGVPDIVLAIFELSAAPGTEAIADGRGGWRNRLGRILVPFIDR
jgi:hypothetical protein